MMYDFVYNARILGGIYSLPITTYYSDLETACTQAGDKFRQLKTGHPPSHRIPTYLGN